MDIKREIKDNCTTYKFSTEADGRVVGWGYLHVIYNDAGDEKYGLLSDIKVKDDYRRHGIGTKIALQIVEEAKKQKCLWLVCYSRNTRPLVHKWYLKLGFKDYGKEFKMEL